MTVTTTSYNVIHGVFTSANSKNLMFSGDKENALAFAKVYQNSIEELDNLVVVENTEGKYWEGAVIWSKVS